MKFAHDLARASTALWGLVLPLFAAPFLAPSHQPNPGGPAPDALHHVRPYRAEVLPGLSDFHYGYAYRINEHGQIAGCSMDANGQVHAVLWQRAHGGEYVPRDLGTLGGGYSCAYGLNEHGDVVGESATTTQAYHAFLWRHGQMVDLGTLLSVPNDQPGANLSAAHSINDHREIVGVSYTDDNVYRGFLWEHGTMSDLGSLGPVGNRPSAALDINAHGDAVGWSVFDPEGSGAVRFHDGQILALGSPMDTAVGINARGDIVGRTASPTDLPRAFFLRAGVLTTIGSPESVAGGLNVRGEVVGYDTNVLDPDTGELFNRAFLWKDGLLRQLPRPEGAHDWFAQSIDAHGRIVGFMYGMDFMPRPVLWTIDHGP